MVGEATVNLQSGAFNVSLNGLTPLADLHGVARRPDRERRHSAAARYGVRTGHLPGRRTHGPPERCPAAVEPAARLHDRPRRGLNRACSGGSEALGAGTVNVFQKIFFRRLSLLNDSTGAVLFDEPTPPPSLSALVPDLAGETDAMAWMGPMPGSPASGCSQSAPGHVLPVTWRGTSSPRLVRTASAESSTGGSVKLDKLISQGAKLFFEETFNGNGRTCGTCHPANNNFTIDAPFIATLPANDPLFVAEFNPALAQLERPQLMRQFGLILENLDGFSNPTTKFVMRGVPHTLGLQVSLERDTDARARRTCRDDRLVGRWSAGDRLVARVRDRCGDAALHQDAWRASRARTSSCPRSTSWTRMEAFQLSLGRSADFNLADITFTERPNANTGKSLFINGGGDPNVGGTCNFCHTNGGALTGTSQNQNRNFNTNVEDVVHPARSVQNFPMDGGFGQTPTTATARSATARSTRPPSWKRQTPRRSFTTTSSTTLEGAVDFYSGPEFNDPRAPAARFDFNVTQRNQIVDFLRGLNTLQNIDVARRELQEILANTGNPQSEQATRLQTAFDETQDGD